MAITRVQGRSANQATATTHAITLPGGITQGNLLIVVMTVGDNATTVTPPDSSWVQAVFNQPSGGGSDATGIWYLPVDSNHSGQTSWTFTLSITQSVIMIATEWKATSSWLNPALDQVAVSASASGTATVIDSGTTLQTAQAEELWIAGLSYMGGVAQAETALTAGWVSDLEDTGSGSSLTTRELYRPTSLTGTAHVSFTIPTAEVWSGCVATFCTARAPSAGRRGPETVQRPFSGVLVKKGYRPRALSATIGTPRALGYLLRGPSSTLIDRGQATSRYPNAVLSDNPVLYYRLNEGVGITVTDFTGNGYDGTLSTGVTERQPGYSALDPNTSMLLTGSASVTIPYTLQPYTWPALSLEYLIALSSGWQHVVTTINASGNILHYLNGVIYNHLPPYLQRALSATLVNPPISSDPILVDLSMSYSGSYLAGDLDEVALYNYVLSPTQIANHYNAALIASLFDVLAGRGTLVGPLSLSTALSCTLAGVGQLSETFTLATALTDTMTGVGTLSPTLQASLALPTVTLAGVGTLTGAITETTALTTTLAGVGTLAETFTLATALTDTLAGVGTLAGPLSLATSLADTLSGVGTLTGTLSLTTALTTTFAGVGTLAGTFSLTSSLISTLAGVGTLTGTTQLATSLTSTLAGVGTLTGSLSASLSLPSVTLAGVGTLTGTAQLTTALSITLVGVGTLAGTTFLSTALFLTLPGVGTLAGNLSLQTALFLTCAGVGTLSPTLIILGGISCALSGSGQLAGTISFPGPSATATWVTRDLRATWVTRDETGIWQTRDDKTTWKTRR